jgi:phage-related protein
MAGPVRIAILANAIQAIRELRQTARESRTMGRALEGVGRVASAVRGRIAGLAAGLLKGVGALAQVASTAAALAPVFTQAGAAILKVGKAFGNAAPALAAFAAAAVFIKLTMVAIGPAVVASLSPITEGFKAAGVEAGKLAAKGVKPLAAEFNRLGMPIISAQMNRIAVASNGVVKGFLNWAKSTPGLSALRNITTATATAFEKVSPHVLKLGTALGEMIGRIAGVSLAAGSSGLTKVLDKVTEKIEGITAQSVQDGFDDLKDAFTSIKDAVITVGAAISKVIDFYKKYQTQINLLSDAFAVFSIVFGGPVVAIVAAVGLVIRHFDQIKEAVTNVKAAFTNPTGATFMERFMNVAGPLKDALVGAFNQIKAAVLPTLQQIRDKIVNDLVPAFLDFIIAVTPVVTFFVQVLTPIVVNSIRTIVTVIKGALDIIIGIVKVFTGILTGDWSTTWAGIKQIVRGAWTIIKGLVTGAFNGIKAAFSAGKAVIVGIWNGLWALVKSAASSAKNAVIAQLAALVTGVRNKFNDAKAAAKEKMANLVADVKSAIGRARDAITSIDLAAAGRALIQGLINGINKMIGPLRGAADKVAGVIKGVFPGSPIKRGPLKSWNRGGAGKQLMDLLIGGIRSRESSAGLASAAVASAVATRFNSMPSPRPLTGTPRLYAGSVQVIFTGVVGDPVEAGRQVDKVLSKYYKTQGRAA